MRKKTTKLSDPSVIALERTKQAQEVLQMRSIDDAAKALARLSIFVGLPVDACLPMVTALANRAPEHYVGFVDACVDELMNAKL